LPAVLFSYRTSINETTGHSPFFLEHGRTPQTPLSTLFTFLRKKEEPAPELFTQEIAQRLDTAFDRARALQTAAAQKNKDRQPEQSKPDFKPGDFLLLKARSAKDGRLVERGEGGIAIPLPQKLRNNFVGPYEMVRWAGDRYCVIRIENKEIIHNVNRLIKHHVWDDVHISTDTSTPLTAETPRAGSTHTPHTPPAAETLRAGSMFVFPMGRTEGHVLSEPAK
jgi:hypothetical protein